MNRRFNILGGFTVSNKQPPHQEENSLLNTNGQASRASEPDLAESHPKETLEQALNDVLPNHSLPKGSVRESHEELRKNFHVRVSGDLAKGLWYLLGWVVVVHFLGVVAFSWRLGNKPAPGDLEENRLERIEKAVSNVNDAAKTLYAVLTPLAATVTGYYFTLGSSSSSSEDSDAKKDN